MKPSSTTSMRKIEHDGHVDTDPDESGNGSFYYYHAFGLNICSSLEIPEFLPGDGVPDVHIRFGKVPDLLEDPELTGVCYQAKPDRFLLKRKKIAKYLVSSGSRITIEVVPGAKGRGIRLFLLGTVFGALLHQREMLPLHASAVKVNDECVIFCGASGYGKSTIARSFIDRGYPLHTDDICVVSVNKQGRPVAFAGYPQLKLWQDILTKMGQDSESFPRVRQVLEKFAVPAPGQFNHSPLPIKKIYILAPYNQKKIKLSPVTGISKFSTLKSQTYRHKFVDGLGMEAVHFKTAGILGNRVPVVTVQRPLKPFLLDELTDTIEKDFGGSPALDT